MKKLNILLVITFLLAFGNESYAKNNNNKHKNCKKQCCNPPKSKKPSCNINHHHHSNCVGIPTVPSKIIINL